MGLFVTPNRETKQGKFDRELDAMTKVFTIMWTPCLPKILEILVAVIKGHPNRNTKEWLAQLPELRALYKSARDNDSAIASKFEVLKICKMLNTFNNGTGVEVLLSETKKKDLMHKLPESMWISFKHRNAFIKLPEALKIIGQAL